MCASDFIRINMLTISEVLASNSAMWRRVVRLGAGYLRFHVLNAVSKDAIDEGEDACTLLALALWCWCLYLSVDLHRLPTAPRPGAMPEVTSLKQILPVARVTSCHYSLLSCRLFICCIAVVERCHCIFFRNSVFGHVLAG